MVLMDFYLKKKIKNIVKTIYDLEKNAINSSTISKNALSVYIQVQNGRHS